MIVAVRRTLRGTRGAVCVGAAALLTVAVADAATIELKTLTDGAALVRISGDLQLADIEDFRTKIAALTKATVELQSDGGSLLAGIRIGSLIRMKNFTTVVRDSAQCASACALMWLGGTRRLMEKGAHIGFHAAYVVKSTGAAQSGPGNALLGAYLDQLGLPESAIIYVTQAAPNSMKWVDAQDAGKHGIEVAVLPEGNREPPPARQSVPLATEEQVQEPAAKQAVGDMKQRAIDFVMALAARWSSPNPEMLRSLDNVYAEHVLYRGKTRARSEVLLDKRRFAQRWPRRVYKIRQETVTATCADNGDQCQIKGTMDWQLASATADRSRGVAKFEYAVASSGDTLKVVAETTTLAEPRPKAPPPNALAQVGQGLQRLLAQITSIRGKPASRSEVVRPVEPLARQKSL
jgi:hypothetical protein